jgi:hypothetical protein
MSIKNTTIINKLTRKYQWKKKLDLIPFELLNNLILKGEIIKKNNFKKALLNQVNSLAIMGIS